MCGTETAYVLLPGLRHRGAMNSQPGAMPYHPMPYQVPDSPISLCYISPGHRSLCYISTGHSIAKPIALRACEAICGNVMPYAGCLAATIARYAMCGTGIADGA
eukprot:3549903-Rhodomonas_salina.2